MADNIWCHCNKAELKQYLWWRIEHELCMRLTCKATAMTSWGRFLRLRRFLNGCFISRATRLASTNSKNSGSTLSIPRIFLSTALPSSRRPRSMRLLGVSTTIRAPRVRRPAGIPAKPRDSLQPHPPSILCIHEKGLLLLFIFKTQRWNERFCYAWTVALTWKCHSWLDLQRECRWWRWAGIVCLILRGFWLGLSPTGTVALPV